jgi:hypothetical protein
MNTLQQTAVHDGAFFSMSSGSIPRGVFDQMGTHVAHIEYCWSTPHRTYRVCALLGGPVDPEAVYLGAVSEPYNMRVVHYYAVPQ